MGWKTVTTLALVVATMANPEFATPAMAQTSEAIEAARRVNISGRQRMLSQRISKASCFMQHSDVAEKFHGELSDSIGLFETSLQALQNGNSTLGLGPEKSADVRASLTQVTRSWVNYSQYLDVPLKTGTTPTAFLADIDKTGLKVLADMNRTVNKTARYYGDLLPDMPLLLSLTIDLAGRQRMLTQKAAKEFCLIDSGVDVEENRARLAETIQIFTTTLDALQNGMAGMVMAAPNEKIRDKLRQVEQAWAGPKAALEVAATGGTLGAGERAEVMEAMEQVLILMNEAVGMYEL